MSVADLRAAAIAATRRAQTLREPDGIVHPTETAQRWSLAERAWGLWQDAAFPDGVLIESRHD